MAPEVWDIDQVNERLAEVSPFVLPEGLFLYYAAVDDLREQTVNPRSMTQGMMNQLSENVQAVGGLESTPLCVRVDKHLEIISGHHRLRAARTAGVKHILVLLYEELSPSRIKSKQLAHNTIAGQDDPQLVKRLWDEITDIQARFEAFVDPRIFEDIPDPVRFTQIDLDLVGASKMVLIAFLPIQEMDFAGAIESILPKGEIDKAYLADAAIYEAWKETLQRVRDEVDIVSMPTAIAEMARLAIEALDARAAAADEAAADGTTE